MRMRPASQKFVALAAAIGTPVRSFQDHLYNVERDERSKIVKLTEKHCKQGRLRFVLRAPQKGNRRPTHSDV